MINAVDIEMLVRDALNKFLNGIIDKEESMSGRASSSVVTKHGNTAYKTFGE